MNMKEDRAAGAARKNAAVRSRMIARARTGAAGLAIRVSRFAVEYGSHDGHLLTAAEEEALEQAARALRIFGNREMS